MLKNRMYLQKQRIVVCILTQYNLDMGKYNSTYLIGYESLVVMS